MHFIVVRCLIDRHRGTVIFQNIKVFNLQGTECFVNDNLLKNLNFNYFIVIIGTVALYKLRHHIQFAYNFAQNSQLI